MGSRLTLFRRLLRVFRLRKMVVFQEPRRSVLYATLEGTLRVTQGFSAAEGVNQYWLEVWTFPGEDVPSYHWRYRTRTTNLSTMQSWVTHYSMQPASQVNYTHLQKPAIDEMIWATD